jgi:hypothetical protein
MPKVKTYLNINKHLFGNSFLFKSLILDIQPVDNDFAA